MATLKPMSRLTRWLALPLAALMLTTGCASRRAISAEDCADPTRGLDREDWGKRVEVTLTSGRVESGVLVAVEGQTLFLRSAPDGPITEVRCDEIARVDVREEHRWLAGAVFMGVVAALVAVRYLLLDDLFSGLN